MTPKIVAKMCRMGMLSDVRDFVGSLPFKIIEEQIDHCVYAGVGEVDTGMKKFPTSVQILKKEDGDMAVFINSKKAGVRVEIPFNTEEERQQARVFAKSVLKKFVN